MDRDLSRLRRAADLVRDDLCRTTEARWRCEVDADFVLTVGDGQVSESVPLGREIEDEDWYVLGDFTPDEQAAAFDDEAAETVADQVVELLRKLDASWPICAEHRRLMSSCSGVWICDGPPPHDVAKVGRLGA